MKKIYIFLAIFLIGCGYIPSSKIASKILGDNVFVDVEMSPVDPKNTVAIKDAIRLGIVSRLNENLVPRDRADTILIAKIRSLTFTKLSYDKYGYVTSYRANLSVLYTLKLKDGKTITQIGNGDHDFRVSRLAKNVKDVNSIISDKDRYDAIENASKQAFNEFISAISIKGLRLDKNLSKN